MRVSVLLKTLRQKKHRFLFSRSGLNLNIEAQTPFGLVGLRLMGRATLMGAELCVRRPTPTRTFVNGLEMC